MKAEELIIVVDRSPTNPTKQPIGIKKNPMNMLANCMKPATFTVPTLVDVKPAIKVIAQAN